MADNGNGIWKWVAITLAAFMLGGVPGYVNQYLNAPTNEEVDAIRQTQIQVLQRLIVLEVELDELQRELDRLEEQVDGK